MGRPPSLRPVTSRRPEQALEPPRHLAGDLSEHDIGVHAAAQRVSHHLRLLHAPELRQHLQQRAEVTAIGTSEAPVVTARREAPDL